VELPETYLLAATDVVEKTSRGVFDFVSESPPPGIVWITVLIAASTLLWNAGVFAVGRLDQSRQRRRSIEDEYWFRTVVSPFCVDSLVQLVDQSSKELGSFERAAPLGERNALYTGFLTSFRGRKNAVLSRFLLVAAFDSSVYGGVSEKIDDMEDVITQHCALHALEDEEALRTSQYANYSVVEQELFSLLSAIIGHLISTHRQMFR